MKNFRKTSAVVLTVVCVLILAFSLVACNINITTNETTDNTEKTVTLVIGEGEGQVVYADYKTTTGSLAAFMEELCKDTEKPLTFDATWTSPYGIFLNSVGSLVPAGGTGEYISILTSDTNYQDITGWATTKTYNGVTVKTATLGATSLPLKDGAVYMFVILVYNG